MENLRKNAILVPIKEPTEIANAIKEILKNEDLAEKFKKNGLETAQKFKWENVTDKFEFVFNEALAKKNTK